MLNAHIINYISATRLCVNKLSWRKEKEIEKKYRFKNNRGCQNIYMIIGILFHMEWFSISMIYTILYILHLEQQFFVVVVVSLLYNNEIGGENMGAQIAMFIFLLHTLLK